MFTEILIANRGEIACRVMLTTRKMGIKNRGCLSRCPQVDMLSRLTSKSIVARQRAVLNPA